MSTKDQHSTTPRVFISYSQSDAAFADALAKGLKRVGIEPWCDTKEIAWGERWDQTLIDAIQRCNVFILVIGNAYSNSVSKEWSAICERQWTEPDVQLIPILLDDAKMPAFVRRFRAVDGHNNNAARCAEVVARYTSPDGAARLEKLLPTKELDLDKLPKKELDELQKRLEDVLRAAKQVNESSDDSPEGQRQ